MKHLKRFTISAMSACLLVSPFGALAQNVMAEEFTEDQPDSTEQKMSDEQLEQLVKSELQLVVHTRNKEGKWSLSRSAIKLDQIFSGTMVAPDTAVITLKPTICPEGMAFYSGVFNGDENAAPLNENYWSEGTEEKLLISKTSVPVVFAEEKWSYIEGGETAEVWCAAVPDFEQLKDAKIRFQSARNAKTYDLALIEKQYDILSINEDAGEEGKLLLEMTIMTEPYAKALEKLTGHKVEFGGSEEEGEPGVLRKSERRVVLEKEKEGKWQAVHSEYDADGIADASKKGIGFYEWDEAAGAAAISMYRLYNPNSSEHFYTADHNEQQYLIKAGWKDEGIGWTAPTLSKTPVYRLYNKNAGDHHYTMDEKEKDELVKAGWTYEKIGWYSDDAKGTPLYRQYNPNAKAGSHNYTIDKKENDYLVKAGWKAEGISWYGLK